ncbi:hypothetical protein EV424DRAFT_1352225 [Suillus variegatus]|nr:hypothetical protein EV424DRAFT_1352225 [Suillus variegatus]
MGPVVLDCCVVLSCKCKDILWKELWPSAGGGWVKAWGAWVGAGGLGRGSDGGMRGQGLSSIDVCMCNEVRMVRPARCFTTYSSVIGALMLGSGQLMTGHLSGKVSDGEKGQIEVNIQWTAGGADQLWAEIQTKVILVGLGILPVVTQPEELFPIKHGYQDLDASDCAIDYP